MTDSFRDPVYDGEVPLESAEDWAASVTCIHHEPEPYVPLDAQGEVIPGQFWLCRQCGEEMYGAPLLVEDA